MLLKMNTQQPMRNKKQTATTTTLPATTTTTSTKTTTIARSLYLSVRLKASFESLETNPSYDLISILYAVQLYYCIDLLTQLIIYYNLSIYLYIFIYIYVYIYSTYINFCYFLSKWLITHSDRTFTITHTHTHTQPNHFRYRILSHSIVSHI